MERAHGGAAVAPRRHHGAYGEGGHHHRRWRQWWFVLAMLRYVHVKCSTKCLAASEGAKLTLTKMTRLLHHGMPGNQTQLYTVQV